MQQRKQAAWRRRRIAELDRQGVSTAQIAQRLGLRRDSVAKIKRQLRAVAQPSPEAPHA